MSAEANAVAEVLDRTRTLCEIPAPPLGESARAAIVAGWWEADNLGRVDIDTAGNVWAQAAAGDGQAILLAAHLDTVFDETTPHGTSIRGERMFGPGVGDNTVAVAALSSAARDLPSETMQHDVWLVATTGEEGLGNLVGIRHALSNPPAPIEALIAIEGAYWGRIATTAVGSIRFRFELECPGGHAWEDRDKISAVHEVAGLAAEIVGLKSGPTDAVNVGRIWGGEAINIRAPQAGMEVDLRADNPGDLHHLAQGVAAEVDRLSPEVRVTSTEIGNRPAGSIDRRHPLVRAAYSALRTAGVEPEYTAASTDANAAFDLGIPAITVGITTGGGEHTPEEWIDLPPVATGIATLTKTVVNYQQEA